MSKIKFSKQQKKVLIGFRDIIHIADNSPMPEYIRNEFVLCLNLLANNVVDSWGIKGLKGDK